MQRVKASRKLRPRRDPMPELVRGRVCSVTLIESALLVAELFFASSAPLR